MNAFYTPGIYPCTVGGMEIFYYHLINEMSKKEKIILITKCSNISNNTNIKVVRIYDKFFLIRRWGFGKISLFLSSIFQIYRFKKCIDVIHITAASNTGFYGSIFPLVKRITGIPFVVSFHGGGLYPWSKCSLYPYLFKNADRSIAISENIKKTLEERTKKKFDFILPLVPFLKTSKTKKQLRIEYKIKIDSKILLMVGSFKAIKGSRFIVESFCSLEKDFILKNNLLLILAGDGEDKVKIQNIIQKNNCTEFVKLFGVIPNELIHEMYSLSDIYIMASKFEGTPKSLLEAMHNSLPIIASNVNGINNIISDEINGLLFEYNNQSCFLSKLKDAISDEEKCIQISSLAKSEYIEKYSFDNTVKSYQSILNNVIQDNLFNKS